MRDHLGWYPEAGDGDLLYAGILIPIGRVRDESTIRYRSAIRRIVAEVEEIGVRVTPNQHLILAHIPASRRDWIERTLAEHGVPFDGEVPRDPAACDGVSGEADLRPCDDACGARAAALSRGTGSARDSARLT